MVSHDRDFLDKVVDHIIAINNTNLDLYCILTKEKVKTYDSGRWLFYDDVPEIESEEYLLKPNIGSFEYLESNKRVYISNKGKIYAFEKNERIMKILHLFSREDKVLIPKDRMDDFEQYVFPQIAPIKIENIPEQLEKQIQPEIVNLFLIYLIIMI